MRWLTKKNPGKKPAGRARAGRWKPLIRRAALPLAALAVIGGLPLWAWQSGFAERSWDQARNAVIDAAARRGFSVQEVTLSGRRFSSRREIIRALALDRGRPMLSVDPDALRDRLLGLPWIEEAAVQRHLPDTVSIQIRERRPMALWQRRGRLVLVDTKGAPITAKRLGRFRHLLIIAGEEAPARAPTLFALLGSEPVLAREVIGATWVGKRRWNLKLKGGIRVSLPENAPYEAWHRLARLNKKHRLLKRDIRLIDLRLPDRMIIKPGAFGRHTTKGDGRNT